MDAKQIDPGHNPLEKMIAGGYLGAVGLEVYKAAAKAGLFSEKAAKAIAGLGALETIDFDNFCAGYRMDGRDNPLDSIFTEEADVKIAKRLGIPVFERAAMLTAIHLAAFVIKTGEGADASAPVAINADGSTYYKTRAIPFGETVEKALQDMLVRRRNIHFEITPQVDDAPMVGAAIAAML
jgi:hexokinase